MVILCPCLCADRHSCTVSENWVSSGRSGHAAGTGETTTRSLWDNCIKWDRVPNNGLGYCAWAPAKEGETGKRGRRGLGCCAWALTPLIFFLFGVFFWSLFFFCGTGVGRIPGCLNRTVPNESTKWPHRPLWTRKGTMRNVNEMPRGSGQRTTHCQLRSLLLWGLQKIGCRPPIGKQKDQHCDQMRKNIEI